VTSRRTVGATPQIALACYSPAPNVVLIPGTQIRRHLDETYDRMPSDSTTVLARN
jgi:hypothetical protein